MKPLERKVLEALAKHKGEVEGKKLADCAGVAYASVMSALSTLEQEGYAGVRRESKQKIVLTEEGKKYAKEGLPEKKLFKALVGGAMDMQAAFKKAGLEKEEQKIALIWAKRNKWVEIKDGQFVPLEAKESETEKELRRAVAGEAKEAKLLLERGLAEAEEEKSVFASLKPGAEKALEAGAATTQITPELLKSGEWKNAKFQPYDLDTVLGEVPSGAKHPYAEFLSKIREKLVGLGFEEEHGPLVELEFWNMDALFMAQDHPAREIHDVFMLEDPTKGEILDKEVVEQVKKAHEEGLEGSKGWRYRWDPEIAVRLVLRSQTTAVSARRLAKGIKPPLRMFSIGRVFRPDEIDWSHFIEFNHCEGIVVDENVNFRELLGYLKRFAVEVFNAEEVKFAPSYFPFTEPSVELYAKIPGRGWAEVGGAGMFRPEMLSALGIKVPVLAWGLGVDRLAMLSLGINDIRDLFSSDLALLKQKA